MATDGGVSGERVESEWLGGICRGGERWDRGGRVFMRGEGGPSGWEGKVGRTGHVGGRAGWEAPLNPYSVSLRSGNGPTSRFFRRLKRKGEASRIHCSPTYHHMDLRCGAATARLILGI